MNKNTIERITSSLAVIFLSFTTFATIFFMADQIFNWDIFPASFEKIIGFILFALFLIIVSSVVVNIMINIGIIANTFQEYFENNKNQKK